MIISILIPVLSLLLQSYPRLLKRSFGVDVWTRLLEVDAVRQNHHRIPKKLIDNQFIIGGYFDYPPIFPILLSYIPKNMLYKIEGFIAPIFDFLQIWIVFFIAYFLTQDLTTSLVAQLLYAVTPIIALENSYLTPRSLGYLNFTLATVPLVFYHFNPIWQFLVIGLVFSTLIFLTHRFATQSFLFASVFLTFYLHTPVFMEVFLASLVLAIVLTRGYYLRVLKGHLSNIYFWVQNVDYRFAHQIRGNTKLQKKSDWVAQIYQFLQVFSPVAVFGLNPWALSGFAIFILPYFVPSLFFFPILQALAALILFFYFFGVLVLKIKYLMPIGEGQRYMEMTTVPSSVLSAIILFSLQNYVPNTVLWIGVTFAVIACLVVIVMIQVNGVLKDKNRSLSNELHATFNYINAQPKILRIVCIPHQNTTVTIFHTSAQVLVNVDNPGLLKTMDVYPILKLTLHQLQKKYKLTHALVRTSFVELSELQVKRSQIEFESGDVKLIRLQ